MDKFVIEALSGEPDVEDGGQARILHIESDDPKHCHSAFHFIRLQSWDETREHAIIRQFEGKRVRVTVEVIE
jgi:hypothetical protein